MSDDAPVLSVQNLTRRFGADTAVDRLSFEVAAGEAYGLLGPNGAGKTTTISMICGLATPDEGEVRIQGAMMTERSVEAKAHVGFVPQEIALYLDLTARENLSFFGRLHGLRGAELAARVHEVLELVQLSDRADHRTATFSGGMKRRVNIAAALLHRPSLLILDEPTVGVDPQSRAAILDGIAELNAAGMAIVYTSHYMEEVERLCHRIGIVDRGRMQAEGSRRELIERLDRADRIELDVDGDEEALAAASADLDGVTHATHGPGTVTLVARAGRRLLPALLERAAAVGADVTSVHVIEPDLEAVFLHLTGRALRDAA
ncbi:MAG: ABC transporter ATP-binding protein [Trueperaceae bacterium]